MPKVITEVRKRYRETVRTWYSQTRKTCVRNAKRLLRLDLEHGCKAWSRQAHSVRIDAADHLFGASLLALRAFRENYLKFGFWVGPLSRSRCSLNIASPRKYPRLLIRLQSRLHSCSPWDCCQGQFCFTRVDAICSFPYGDHSRFWWVSAEPVSSYGLIPCRYAWPWKSAIESFC